MNSMQHSLTLQTDPPLAPPRLDEPAPYFEGRSTQGPIKLSDYAGRWLVFFAHPARFTPVCASELVAFARHSAEFAALKCSLLGLSVDSVYCISPGARVSATASA